MFNLSTFNVHYLIEPDKIGQFIVDNSIDVCAMQEVPGEKQLNKLLTQPALRSYKGLFDNTYKTYGNGLVYCTNKFTFVESKNHIIGSTNGRNKRSAFRVVLKHIETAKLMIVYVIHLDHLSESNRIKQFKAFNEVCNANGDYKRKYVVLGDLNALTQTDYTVQRDMEITIQRRHNKIEDPSSELTDLISNQGFFDAAQHFGTPQSTSRFNTRIDYILFNPYCNVLDGYVSDVHVVDTKDTSDHLPVVCKINPLCF